MTGASTILVPKGPRVESERNVAEMRAALFALPVPPPPLPHRTYPIHTPLGRVMRHKQVTIEDVVRLPIPGMPNARIMSDMLAGRRDVGPLVAQKIARGLGVDWRVIATAT